FLTADSHVQSPPVVLRLDIMNSPTSERLECYVPRHVRKVYQCDSKISQTVNSCGFPFFIGDENSAVAIIDISGYSNLTTELSKTLGNSGAGADKLRAIINITLDRLVQIVTRSGGDIFKFAGDSMICCWSSQHTITFINGTNQDLAPCSPTSPNLQPEKSCKERAFRCCLDILYDFQNHEDPSPFQSAPLTTANIRRNRSHTIASPTSNVPTDSVINLSNKSEKALSLHIGFGLGHTCMVHVGVPGVRRECFLVGKSVLEASEILDIAGKGEMALTRDAWNALSILFPCVDELVEVRSNEIIVLANAAVNRLLGKEVKEVVVPRHAIRRRSFMIMPTSTMRAEALTSTSNENLGSNSPLRFERKKSLVSPPPMLPFHHEVSVFPMFVNTELKVLGSIVPTAPQFKEYINEALVARLSTSNEDQQFAVNMIRKLTVVFIKIADFPVASALESMKIAQNIMEIIIPPLRQHEGTMRQFNVDDKGATVLLVW
ncbi:hypothetical protein HK096_008926, partial [Nowakowskiella sp. JEL0078]